MQEWLVEESSCSTYLGLFPRAAGVDVVGRADLKRQVPEKCFPTDHEGNGTEESNHEQRVLGRWWLQTLPTQSKAGPNMCHALVGPCCLAHVVWDSMGLSPQGSFSALATFHKGVPQELQISLR